MCFFFNFYICEPNKDNGFSLFNQDINETGALDDLDYFDTLDKDIIPPYWIVAGCVLVAGVITIIAGKQEKHFLTLRRLSVDSLSHLAYKAQWRDL